MKLHYYLRGALQKGNIDPFIDFMNENHGREVKIFISSEGGDDEAFWILKSIIEQSKDLITLVANGEIMSNAFKLFYSLECNREIRPETIGMFHYSGFTPRILENNRPAFDEDKARLAVFKEKAEQTDAWCSSIGMNKKEIRAVKAGKDVFFSNSRLNELFLHQSKKKISPGYFLTQDHERKRKIRHTHT